MFENFLKDVFDDFSEVMDNIKNQIQETKKEETKPFIFYRKFRFKKKIKRRYMIRVNPVKSLIADNLIYGLKFGKTFLNMIMTGEKI